MKSSDQKNCARPSRRDFIGYGAAGLASIVPSTARSEQADVALAGLAYAGDFASIKTRFPYSQAYESSLRTLHRFPAAMLLDATRQNPPRDLKIVSQIDELKGRDQAIAVALVIGSETVSVEQIAGLHKLFVLIRAQALFFDFKAMSVVRAYPISFAQIDVFDRPPARDEVSERVRGIFEGAGGKPGLFGRFGATLAKASLPAATSRYLGVAKVSVKPETLVNMPDYLKTSPGSTDTWAADLVGEALSTRAGVPIVPYSAGDTLGKMSMRISDGDVYNLKLPKPDYEIDVELTRLVKKKFGESAAGVSYIYGLVSTLKITEPMSGKVYLNAELKNGEVKLVPATQTYVDDFPAFYDSINGLFVKLSEAVNSGDMKWVKSAAAAPDIEKQIADTRELVRLCK